MPLMKVTAGKFTHEFHFFSDHEIFFDRRQEYTSNYSVLDVYGSFWSFLFAHVPAKGVRISQGKSSISVSGRVGMLVPPGSIVEWKINCPRLHWFAYSNNRTYPESFPNALTVFELNDIPATVSPDWIRNLIKTSKPISTIKNSEYNPYAKKFKSILDNEYKLNKSLDDYAAELGLSKEWLIKYFKKSYGVTPVDYRNRKRIMEAIFLLHVDDEKIVDLSQRIGFNDLKHFNQLFKKAITLPPSKFLRK